MKFDAIYSGFLGSAEQIALIADLARRFSPKHVIIDPVMADNGVLYKTYTQEMCAGMKNLVKIADYVTPNLTEACVLTDTKYDLEKTSYDDIKALAAKIKSLGAKNVIITGIERGNTLYNCILDDTGYSERAVPLLPYRMHGTGDLFTSVLAGGILTGHNLYESVDSAAEFVPIQWKSQNYEDSHRRECALSRTCICSPAEYVKSTSKNSGTHINGHISNDNSKAADFSAAFCNLAKRPQKRVFCAFVPLKIECIGV